MEFELILDMLSSISQSALVMWRSWVQAPSKAPVVSLSKKLYPCCLVLVSSRNGFERDFTIELK